MTSYVYFIKPVGQDGPIKIGSSVDPQARLQAYLLLSPVFLELALTIPGDAELERNIHDCFADDHSHHEWFHASPRLLAAIAALKAGTPAAEAIDLSDRRGNVRYQTILDKRLANGTLHLRPRPSQDDLERMTLRHARRGGGAVQ